MSKLREKINGVETRDIYYAIVAIIAIGTLVWNLAIHYSRSDLLAQRVEANERYIKEVDAKIEKLNGKFVLEPVYKQSLADIQNRLEAIERKIDKLNDRIYAISR